MSSWRIHLSSQCHELNVSKDTTTNSFAITQKCLSCLICCRCLCLLHILFVFFSVLCYLLLPCLLYISIFRSRCPVIHTQILRRLFGVLLLVWLSLGMVQWKMKAPFGVHKPSEPTVYITFFSFVILLFAFRRGAVRSEEHCLVYLVGCGGNGGLVVNSRFTFLYLYF